MSEMIRISYGEDWTYVVAGGDNHKHANRFIDNGMAETDQSGIRLRSEAGPMLWDLMGVKQDDHDPSSVIASMTESGLALFPGEEVCFGKRWDHHNEFADLSWRKDESIGNGVKLSRDNIGDGVLVLTAWPKSKNLIPGRVIIEERPSVELVESPGRGDRCFVLDEHGNCLLTASMESDGTEFVRILPRVAVASWLSSIGSSSSMGSRFSVADRGNSFAIEDLDAGRTYTTYYATKDKKREIEQVKYLLEYDGLGAVIPKYDLENASG